MYLGALAAAKDKDFDRPISETAAQLKNARPTAVNLGWAIERQLARMATIKNIEEKIALALETTRSRLPKKMRNIAGKSVFTAWN
jgi:methylthioribose-1-phosphate isomerase